MARRPQVTGVSDGTDTGIVIDVIGQEPLMVTLVQAEDIQTQLGALVNTYKGLHKRLPLRDRLRAFFA